MSVDLCLHQPSENRSNMGSLRVCELLDLRLLFSAYMEMIAAVAIVVAGLKYHHLTMG